MTLNIGDYPLRYISAGTTWEPVTKLREKEILAKEEKTQDTKHSIP
jgi:hypothetical protein